jgi:hypothetical protein
MPASTLKVGKNDRLQGRTTSEVICFPAVSPSAEFVFAKRHLNKEDSYV